MISIEKIATAMPMKPRIDWEAQMRAFQKLRDERLHSGDYRGYLGTFDSHRRLRPFCDIIPLLSPKQYWPLLRDVWIMSEVSTSDGPIWLKLFRSKRPHRELLMTEVDRKYLAGRPDQIKVWRGFGCQAGKHGFSWTLDRSRAKFFAEYSCGTRRQYLTNLGGKVPMIAEGVCPKSKVIAFFSERGESEIIVLPKDVKVLHISRVRVSRIRSSVSEAANSFETLKRRLLS
jgi:hypothetical protein